MVRLMADSMPDPGLIRAGARSTAGTLRYDEQGQARPASHIKRSQSVAHQGTPGRGQTVKDQATWATHHRSGPGLVGRRLWATSEPVPDAGRVWQVLADMHQDTGLVPILLAFLGKGG